MTWQTWQTVCHRAERGSPVLGRAVVTTLAALLALVLVGPLGAGPTRGTAVGFEGSSSASLPPGGPIFFKLTSGIRSIPVGKAYSAQVSLEPTFTQPGS